MVMLSAWKTETLTCLVLLLALSGLVRLSVQVRSGNGGATSYVQREKVRLTGGNSLKRSSGSGNGLGRGVQHGKNLVNTKLMINRTEPGMKREQSRTLEQGKKPRAKDSEGVQQGKDLKILGTNLGIHKVRRVVRKSSENANTRKQMTRVRPTKEFSNLNRKDEKKRVLLVQNNSKPIGQRKIKNLAASEIRVQKGTLDMGELKSRKAKRMKRLRTRSQLSKMNAKHRKLTKEIMRKSSDLSRKIMMAATRMEESTNSSEIFIS